VPYVASISWGDGNYVRNFFELDRIYAKDSIVVHGSYSVQEGEIIELCRGGNSSRKYRSLYIVHMGRLDFLTKTDDAKGKFEVKKYLECEIDDLELRNSLAF
jgi:hypothetical protein